MEQIPKKIERIKITDERPEVFMAVRTKILENFKNKTDGMNIKRVEDFMKENGLPLLEYIIYDKEDILEIDEMLEGLYELDPGMQAGYVSSFNLIFLKRERENCRLNGNVYDEGKLIHELGHSSTRHAHYSVNTKTKQAKVTRVGFYLSDVKHTDFVGGKKQEVPWGGFLEEGFADMLRGEYIERNMSADIRKKIQEKMKSIAREDDDWQYDMNPKYIFIDVPNEDEDDWSYDAEPAFIDEFDEDETTWVNYMKSAIAATGLEMLCEKIPILRQTLIEARSDIEKLREIPKLLNAIKPGLYMEIQKCDYSDEEFTRVQNIIKDAIQNSE
jgi:hypothetical protein